MVSDGVEVVYLLWEGRAPRPPKRPAVQVEMLVLAMKTRQCGLAGEWDGFLKFIYFYRVFIHLVFHASCDRGHVINRVGGVGLTYRARSDV